MEIFFKKHSLLIGIGFIALVALVAVFLLQKHGGVRTIAQNLQPYEFPTQVQKYHCILQLKAEEPVGNIAIATLYRTFERTDFSKELVVFFLQTQAAESMSKSVLSGFEQKIYCRTEEYQPIE